MMNVCYQCGIYRADKNIDPSGPYAICPECGYKHPFVFGPLLMISGASGSGKTTVCRTLFGKVKHAVLMESDIIWRSEFNTPETKYKDFFETWLRICKNISQSGHPVALFGAGCGVPENIEPCVERRYFSQVHYLAIVCSDEILRERLLSRPEWRNTREPEFIAAQIKFNHWFKAYADRPPISLIDNSSLSIEETSRRVEDWIKEKLPDNNQCELNNQ